MEKISWIHSPKDTKRCVNCSAVNDLQEYGGDMYCERCLQEWLAMQ